MIRGMFIKLEALQKFHHHGRDGVAWLSLGTVDPRTRVQIAVSAPSFHNTGSSSLSSMALSLSVRVLGSTVTRSVEPSTMMVSLI